jgi:hypothetical protein
MTGRQTRILPPLAAILLVVGLAAPTAAASTDDVTALATLDLVVADYYDEAKAALTVLANDSTDLAARSRLAQASRAAIAALDTADVRDCFRDWHTVARAAFWLLARSMDLIDAYEAAVATADVFARNAAQMEMGQTIPPGVSLLYYVPVMRQRVTCVGRLTPPSRPGNRVATRSLSMTMRPE